MLPALENYPFYSAVLKWTSTSYMLQTLDYLNQPKYSAYLQRQTMVQLDTLCQSSQPHANYTQAANTTTCLAPMRHCRNRRPRKDFRCYCYLQ